MTGHRAVGTLIAASSLAIDMVSRVERASSRSLCTTTTYGMPSAARWLGLGKTPYWAIGESPRAQVGSRNTVDLEAGILSSDPITKLGFKSLLARGTTDLVVAEVIVIWP